MSTQPKESKDVKDPALRKKRRTVKTESRSSSPDSSSKKPKSQEDPSKQNVKSIFYYEETEASDRNMDQDVATHRDACAKLQDIMAQMKALKEGGKRDSAELEELKVQGLMQFVVLKKMNRMAHFKCKKVRDATHDEKQQIDQHHLQLQNLLYEVMHLQKEITKCMEFKSKDEDINLVSPEEFYQEAPPEISKPEVTKKDLHQQTLARLDWELEQRKQLSEKLQQAKTKKTEILKETKNKKSYLDSLQPKLNSILQATKPVQEYLDMPFDEIREQHKTATFLPRPLYVLYMQASAYRDACDKYLTVNILGDIDVAKVIGDKKDDLDEDSDQSDQEESEKVADQKRRRRGTRTGKDKVSKVDKILRKHPLCVHLHIQCKDGSILYLTFDYLMVLEIVTVTVRLVTPQDTNVVSAGDLLSADSLLTCLYPEDFGSDTPNSSNIYAFQKAKMGSFPQYINKVGRPYHWVQWLCGLQFLNESEKGKKSEPQRSASHIEATIKRLRKRVKARISLAKQLACLEKFMVSVSTEYQSLFPVKLCSRLTSWKRITYDDFCSTPYTQHIAGADLARDSDLYFTGVIERGSAKMKVQVQLVPEYPEEPPLFAVCVEWKSHQKTRLNDENIRDIEAEVNIHYAELAKDKSHDQLLTNQIQRLLMCFDVYLETMAENTQDGPSEFAREKIFTRTARGPLRSKPYVYNRQLGFFMQR